MRRNPTSQLLALLLTIATPAFPATPWLRINSPNFELFTTAGEKKGKEAILHFEQVRSLFDKLADSKSFSSLPVRIIAFQSENEYAAYRINESAVAYYLGGQERDYIVMKSIASEYYPMAIHEYVHLVERHSGLRLPVWLNEGLAEVYAPLKPIGKKVQLGEIIPGRYQELQTKKWLDLETLIAVDQKSPLYNEKQKAGIFYAESWALTHMLYLSNEYWPKFGEFLPTIKADSSQAEVFQRVYGKSLKQVQDDLVSYMRGTRFNAGLVDVKLEKSAESPEVRAATGLESGLALADLLAVTRKRKEAGAAYETLARDYPKEPEIPVAMARLAWMNSDREEMKRQFAKAIELGTKSAKIYTDYAAMLQQANAPSTEIAGILGRALELDSDLVEARYRLGLVLMSESRFGEAAIQLSQVKKLEKQMASPYYQALSYSHYRLGLAELARTEAANAVKYALDDGQTKRAQDLVAIVSREPVKAPITPKAGTPPVETADGRPHLARRETPEDAPPQVTRQREQTYPVEGTLQQVDCLGNVARLRVLAGNKPFALLIEDPQRVTIKSSGAEQIHEFTCGAQKPARVAIEYVPKPDSRYQTEGTIRSLEFR